MELLGKDAFEFRFSGHVDGSVCAGSFDEKEPLAGRIPDDHVRCFLPRPEFDAKLVHSVTVDYAHAVIGVIDVQDDAVGYESGHEVLNDVFDELVLSTW